MMHSGKVLKALLAGFAAGAVVGVLFAPSKGIITRQKIARKKDDYTKDLKAKYDELRDMVSGKFSSARQNAKNAASKAKEAIKLAEQDANHLAWEVKNASR